MRATFHDEDNDEGGDDYVDEANNGGDRPDRHVLWQRNNTNEIRLLILTLVKPVVDSRRVVYGRRRILK